MLMKVITAMKLQKIGNYTIKIKATSPGAKELKNKVSHHINGLVQDCSNSIANALELLQPCTKP